MAMNRMNLLLSKIERRLGTKPLMLPEDINKDKWVDEVIIPDTIATFSRYFPHMVRIQVDSSPENRKDGYYIIDTDLLGGVDILGVKDIAWDVYGNDGLAQQSGIGMYDYLGAYNNYTIDDLTSGLPMIPIDIFVNHPSNLSTIPPTQMETFEKLALADVASFLVSYLQHYDGLETVFANVDLKLSSLEKYADRRDEIVQILDDAHVNPANKNQPIMYCV